MLILICKKINLTIKIIVKIQVIYVKKKLTYRIVMNKEMICNSNIEC